ncbi:MAG: hypothetical protein KDK64_04345 [Chlamydiia bacterium]|nr:hypothetical protein [Chlamydiia bacterium]
MEIVKKAGYSNPQQSLERFCYCFIIATLTTGVAKVLIPSSSLASHMIFNGTTSTIALAMWENDHPKKWMIQSEPNKQWWANVVGFTIFSFGSLWTARVVTGLAAEGISKKNMIARGLFLVGAGTASAYTLESWRQHQRN